MVRSGMLLLCHKYVLFLNYCKLVYFSFLLWIYIKFLNISDKSDSARRFLSKAASLDRLFGPAWLAYGHSFAVENEHDQAMAAYFKASQLMKGYLVN